MNTLPEKNHEPVHSFDVEGTLGRLAKWLRIIGFDAAFPRKAPSQARWFVTMKKGLIGPGIVVVTRRAVLEQLQEVLEQIGIEPDPSLFLSRCLVCNETVVEASRKEVEGKIPRQVYESKSEFHRCPACGRTYWEGSHADRIKLRLAQTKPGSDPPHRE